MSRPLPDCSAVPYFLMPSCLRFSMSAITRSWTNGRSLTWGSGWSVSGSRTSLIAVAALGDVVPQVLLADPGVAAHLGVRELARGGALVQPARPNPEDLCRLLDGQHPVVNGR